MNQFSVFFVIAFLSAAVSLILAAGVLRFRYVPGSASFAIMLLLTSLWTFSVGMGMISNSIQAANIWILFRMIGVIFSPLAWIVFVYEYSGHHELLNLKILTGLSIVPLLSTLMLITNSTHHLFIESIQFVEHPPFLVDESWNLGYYYWFHFVYSYVLILIGDYFMLREAFRMSKRHRTRAISLVIGTLIPLVVNFSFSLHLIPALKVNYDSLGLVISGIIFAWTIFNYQLFDFSPIALRVLVDNMVDGVIVVDNQHRVVDINPTALHIFELEKGKAVGNKIAELIPSTLDIDSLLKKHSTQSVDMHLDIQEADEYYDLSLSVIRHGKNELGYLITIRNITSRKNVELEWQKIAITDALTGLSNHRHFYELLRGEFYRSIRLKKSLGLIMFDIDHFKKINDLHGHLVGDQILREMAQICSLELRVYDHFCRYGGEEFTVILPETTNEEAAKTAERLREIVAAENFKTSSGELNVTISLGVSSLNPAVTSSVEQFVQQADMSLYQAKKEGRNRVSVWKNKSS
ncbi:MAG TPA: diguanylate cyclase [Anaerolineales bacterium]|nr:diguanylate cyclase [Anaerolineales bacterium]